MKTVSAWSPLHEGEIAVQKRVGVLDEVSRWAPQAIRSYMVEQHRQFFRQLPFIAVSARDAAGAPWATLLVGAPGFVQSPDSEHMRVGAMPIAGDALEMSFFPGAEVGLLGIELETRRRNRANGKVTSWDEEGFTVAVDQSYGNCPQYISKRIWHRAKIDGEKMQISYHTSLDERMKSWIARADTLFIASGLRKTNEKERSSGMDVSHRGGRAGFVKISSDSGLVLPDYAGNNLFNTVGNLVVDPRVGLLFVDFEDGSMLQMSGNAEIDWDSNEISRHAGAKRLINIEIDRIVKLDHALPLRWSAPEGAVRELLLANKVKESEDVTSFEFVPRDNGRLPLFKAGQYLPIELQLDGNEVVERTYSLSNRPGEDKYRISVKREKLGLVSRLLHDHLSPGDVILAKEPEGKFILPLDNDRPIVLISAGIGITPMVSMLHVLAKQERQVYFVHGARNGTHSPLMEEVADLARSVDSIHLYVLYSQPHSEDMEGIDYHRTGRVDGRALERFVPMIDAEFYVCGPKKFLADIVSYLIERGIAEKDIHIESFT